MVTESDAAFVERQRHRLVQLRERLARGSDSRSQEQRAANEQAHGEAQEFEDDAQKLAILELADNVTAANAMRLSNVQRALQKIDEGTYGLSDESGAAIPRERLEAAPEALYTVAEQDRLELARASPLR